MLTYRKIVNPDAQSQIIKKHAQNTIESMITCMFESGLTIIEMAEYKVDRY
jgi:hypothetical protein